MIGENIQRIRQRKGFTLSEAAQKAKISKSYLSNIERNLNHNPSIHIIEKIAAALEVDIRTLLGSKSINQLLPENEWLEFIKELKQSGVDKDQLSEYKSVIEFAKWQNERLAVNTNESKCQTKGEVNGT